MKLLAAGNEALLGRSRADLGEEEATRGSAAILGAAGRGLAQRGGADGGSSSVRAAMVVPQRWPWCDVFTWRFRFPLVVKSRLHWLHTNGRKSAEAERKL